MKTRLICWGVFCLIGFSAQLGKAQPGPGEYYIDFSGESLVWDLSGSYEQSADGVDLSFTMSQDPKGRLTGWGTFSIDIPWQGSLEGDVRVTGSLKNSGTVARVQFKISLDGSGIVQGETVYATASESVKLEIDQATGVMFGSAKIKICVRVGREKQCESAYEEAFYDIPGDMDGGWQCWVDLTSSGTRLAGTAEVYLVPDGAVQALRTLRFAVSGSYATRTGATKVKLTGTGYDRGSKLSFTADQYLKDPGGFTIVTGERLSGKIFGQKVRAQ